jgi:hypothetical protein
MGLLPARLRLPAQAASQLFGHLGQIVGEIHHQNFIPESNLIGNFTA